MSGFRHSEDRGELVMSADLKPGTQLPPEVCPAPPTLKETLLAVDAPEWEAVLRAARHDFYHLPAYLALCAGQERGRRKARDRRGGGRSRVGPRGAPPPTPGHRRRAASPSASEGRGRLPAEAACLA